MVLSPVDFDVFFLIVPLFRVALPSAETVVM